MTSRTSCASWVRAHGSARAFSRRFFRASPPNPYGVPPRTLRGSHGVFVTLCASAAGRRETAHGPWALFFSSRRAGHSKAPPVPRHARASYVGLARVRGLRASATATQLRPVATFFSPLHTRPPLRVRVIGARVARIVCSGRTSPSPQASPRPGSPPPFFFCPLLPPRADLSIARHACPRQCGRRDDARCGQVRNRRGELQ